MSIRVGRCIYNSSGRLDPSYPGFTPIVVLSKSASEWGIIGPYELKDEYGRIFEDYWQFSKIYSTTNAVKEKYPLGRFGKVIWEWPADTHISENKVTLNYAVWRQRGIYCNRPVRFPNGKDGARECVCAFPETKPILPGDSPQEVLQKLGTPLTYIPARKEIYAKEYIRLVRAHPKYLELLSRVRSGENLLIIEVDGPHQESLEYYQSKYGVSADFIQGRTMLVTLDNIKIMLNDPLHAFGHGYCLAMALLNMDELLV